MAPACESRREPTRHCGNVDSAKTYASALASVSEKEKVASPMPTRTTVLSYEVRGHVCSRTFCNRDATPCIQSTSHALVVNASELNGERRPLRASHNIGVGPMRPLEDRRPFAITVCNLRGSLFACDFFREEVGNRIPESGTPDSEADETVHGRRDLQPAPHLHFIGTVPQHNAADVISSTTLCHFDDALALITTVKPLDLPNIRFDSGVLECANGIEH